MLNRFRFVFICILLLVLVLPSSALAAKKSSKNFRWQPLGKVKNLQEGSLDKMQCPTARFCVTGGSHAIWVSLNPSQKASKWKRVDVSTKRLIGNPPSLTQSYIQTVACSDVSFCTVGDSNSMISASLNPQSAKKIDWSAKEIPYTGMYAGVGAISCTSSVFCAALDVNGYVMTSTSPVAGVWSSKQYTQATNAGMYEIDCKKTVCIFSQTSPYIWTIQDSSVLPVSFRKVKLGTAQKTIQSVACKNEKVCIAVGYRNARVSTNAISGSKATWKIIPALNKLSSVEHVSCSEVMCAATSGTDVWWTSKPQSVRSWKKAKSKSKVILGDISCPTARLCIANNVAGQLFIGRR